MKMMLLRLVSLLIILQQSSAYFKWSNCESKAKRSGFDSISKNASHIRYVHGCEDGKPVSLSCEDGYKIAVLYVFFGHGYSHRSTCDESWFGQNCLARGAAAKVKYLCQNKQFCVIHPISYVLGSTSCTFGLDSDLHIRYTCNREYIPNTFVVNSVKISPDPLTLPGKLNISISISTNRYLPESTKLKLKISKKVGLWVRVPCVADFGSCTYKDFCRKLRKLMFNTCTKEMEAKGVPCDCPIPTGTFTIPTQTVTVTSKELDEIPIPDFLVNGKYYLKAEFFDVYDNPLGCVEVYLQVRIQDKKKRALHIKKITVN